MDYSYITSSILKVYEKCNVESFPIDCIDIIEKYGLSCYKYSQLDNRLKQYCLMFSDDAFKYKDKVCYNDENNWFRSRFSLMHELGHIVLDTKSEPLANLFASMILAPPIAIYYSKCKTKNELSKTFKISYQAAGISLKRYNIWYNQVLIHNNKICKADKNLYNHFFNEQEQCFVWNIRKCTLCKKTFLNSINDCCYDCRAKINYAKIGISRHHHFNVISEEDKNMLRKWENIIYFNI